VELHYQYNKPRWLVKGERYHRRSPHLQQGVVSGGNQRTLRGRNETFGNTTVNSNLKSQISKLQLKS